MLFDDLLILMESIPLQKPMNTSTSVVLCIGAVTIILDSFEMMNWALRWTYPYLGKAPRMACDFEIFSGNRGFCSHGVVIFSLSDYRTKDLSLNFFAPIVFIYNHATAYGVQRNVSCHFIIVRGSFVQSLVSTCNLRSFSFIFFLTSLIPCGFSKSMFGKCL